MFAHMDLGPLNRVYSRVLQGGRLKGSAERALCKLREPRSADALDPAPTAAPRTFPNANAQTAWENF